MLCIRIKKKKKTEPRVEPKINICEIIIMHASFYNCNAIDLEWSKKKSQFLYVWNLKQTENILSNKFIVQKENCNVSYDTIISE